MSDETIMPFDFPAENPTIIKVIGVGGGGGNAVNHMYKEGIHDVTFVVCNTDNQALAESPVPVKLQLGKEGLGAGNRPERAREAAEESIEDVKGMLNDGCKMVFITAGMGGGTGTGAAPVIAQCAKEMGILTVGIVTIPFRFEGLKKIDQALDGVEEISKHVDALLVINNERLREIYPELTVLNAFAKADDTLSVAAKSIAEIITMRGTVNLDFADVQTVMKDKGLAHIGIGMAKGDDKAIEAVKLAVTSPLLETTINGASHVIINISGDISLMDANDAASYVEDLAGDNANIIFGAKYDETMTDAATITVIATGLEENAAKTTASSNLMSGLKYPNTAATTRPVINSGLVNRTANVTTNSSFGATSTLGQTAAQQPAPAASPFIGITKPKRPESTVHEKDIKIPEFLKSTKK